MSKFLLIIYDARRWQQQSSSSAISAAPRALAKVKQPLSDNFIFITLVRFRGDKHHAVVVRVMTPCSLVGSYQRLERKFRQHGFRPSLRYPLFSFGVRSSACSQAFPVSDH